MFPRIFAKEVVDKVKELDEEKKKTEKAFHDFLPPSIVKDIKEKKVSFITLLSELYILRNLIIQSSKQQRGSSVSRSSLVISLDLTTSQQTVLL